MLIHRNFPMRKVLLILAPLFLVIGLLSGIIFFLSKNAGKGALQVTASPQSKVYLNSTLIGENPLCKCEQDTMLGIGEYTIRIEPLDRSLPSFEEKITIAKSILTVVDRTFGAGAASEGSIITLQPLSDRNALELLIVTFPEQVKVFVDGSQSGTSPLLLKNFTASDHEIKLEKDGYKDKTLRVRTISGYKLLVTAFLGIQVGAKASPVPQLSLSPTASPSPTIVVQRITILQTPTGFLRVRAEGSVSANEIGRVYPSETYELLAEVQGWYKVKLANGTEGWISAQYAQKN